MATRFRDFAWRGLRVTRALSLGVGFFGAGYTMGVSDFARDPDGMDAKALITWVKNCTEINTLGYQTGACPQTGHVTPQLYRVLGELEQPDYSFAFDISSVAEDDDATGTEDIFMNTKRVSLYNNESVPHGPAIATSMKRIQTVGRKVLNAARDIVDEEIDYKVRALMLQESDPDELSEANTAANVEPGGVIVPSSHFDGLDLAQLKKARVLLQQTWQFVVMDMVAVNAFVAQNQPRRIFVGVPLSLMAQSDEELAVVMAHEVSHALAGHTDDQSMMHVGMLAFQAVLLSLIDPTGVLGFALDFTLFADGLSIFEKEYSQECEHEADAFGLNILARACYDVEKGSLFFKRLDKLEHDLNPLSEMTELDHARNVSESQQWSLSQMYSTHPVTANRIEELDTLAERIKHRYPNGMAHCQDNAVWYRSFTEAWGHFMGQQKTSRVVHQRVVLDIPAQIRS